VQDRSNFSLQRAQLTPRGVQMQTQTLAGLIDVRETDADKKPTGQIDPEEPVVAGINSIPFLLPAAMQTDSAAAFKERHPAATLSAFARTSPEAWSTEPKDGIGMFNVTPPPREEWGSFVVAGRATGRLRSYFADKPVPTRAGSPPEMQADSRATVRESTPEHPAQLWVVADADFVSDIWINAFQQSGAMNIAQAFMRGFGVMMNIVDVATVGQELVDIRRAKLLDRTVDEDRVKADRTTSLWMNIGLMPAVLIALGLVRWWMRSVQTFVPSPKQQVVVARAAPDVAASQPPPEASGAGSPSEDATR
jgi:hypothetical protein